MLLGAVPVLPVLPVDGLQRTHLSGRASPGHAGASTGSRAVWPGWGHWADGTGQGRRLRSWGCRCPPLGDLSKSLPVDAELLGGESVSSEGPNPDNLSFTWVRGEIERTL